MVTEREQATIRVLRELRDYAREKMEAKLTGECLEIIGLTAKEFRLPAHLIFGGRGSETAARMRAMAMYRCRKLTEASYPELGRVFGRHHSTVIHAVELMEERYGEKQLIGDFVERLTEGDGQ